MSDVTIVQLIQDLELEVIYPSKRQEEVKITISDVNRPGLQLAGFYKYFAYERVQVIGRVEWTYFGSLSSQVRKQRAKELFSYPIPCLILTRELEVYEELLEAAVKFDIPLLRTKASTTKFISRLTNYLEDKLAPVITRHGVLVEVYGIGILMIGESGIGKSETALELIKRGHRLVADDAVEIKKVDNNTLVGSAPEIIRHFMEIRGIGILDVVQLFGVGAVRNTKMIDMVIELENWDDKKQYDRLGLDEEYINILGLDIPKNTIPIKPGRNLAMIVEVAARNHRQKRMGFNAAETLNNRILKQMNGENEKERQ
ncbi:HPr(Ser) kinase/phosphatase [Thermotalea metallivorans]|uniref:HPr kinase/phosphorylase n=1 Tax=Thermotalea metallivorans TaxID=520762 RepID=A0A140L3Y3_9FIRM|nr:HPr(Ser) kinase/phosphatase [Thermotalea metallivorans]KXG75258.1 HPr kinase/phosphorylase [Thermotalea metallivorans]